MIQNHYLFTNDKKRQLCVWINLTDPKKVLQVYESFYLFRIKTRKLEEILVIFVSIACKK